MNSVCLRDLGEDNNRFFVTLSFHDKKVNVFVEHTNSKSFHRRIRFLCINCIIYVYMYVLL